MLARPMIDQKIYAYDQLSHFTEDQGGEVYTRHKPGLIALKRLFVVEPLAGEQEQYNLILVKPDAAGAIQLLVRQAG